MKYTSYVVKDSTFVDDLTYKNHQTVFKNISFILTHTRGRTDTGNAHAVRTRMQTDRCIGMK